jgi:multiple sugar transport system substrate-binding protein
MGDSKRGRFSRRQFVKAAATALGAGALPGLACAPGDKKMRAVKTLRILQWSHFVPGYDRWFDDVYTKEWGAKHGTEVVVDHMAATEVNARGAAEAAARKGHDLFLFISPPAAYEGQVIDHKEVVDEVERQHGKMIPLARKSTLDPKTGKYFAFSDSYVPDPGNYRIDLWSDVGFPNGPDTWEDLRAGGRRIKEKFGNPVGIGLSQEMDSNMAARGVLWSFGGAEQDENGNVVLNTKETVAALEFMRALYKETETAEVFTWDPASNNRMMLAGRASFIQNAISVPRTAEKENPAMAKKIGLVPALKGPVRRIAAEHVMNCYVVWKFADNIDGAKQFLVDLVGNFGSVFRQSEFYNFPCYPTTVPDIADLLANDPKADPPGKYKALSGVLDWATNVGYPGYATAATDEVFNTFVIPTMFARVARDEMTAEAAAAAAQKDVERIFKKWRSA